MYEPYETDISHKILKTVIASLEEPICLLGGWAVYLHVNKNFKKETGREYIGSRDIDLGFHLEPDWNESQLRSSTLARSMQTIEKLGFKAVGFRYLKEFHTESYEELDRSKLLQTPSHFVFPLYIDPIVDIIPPLFHRVFRFHPVDEPLLKRVFSNPSNRKITKSLGKNLWLPKTHVLLATKLNSLTGRDKEHKKLKDIADIFALLWYSDTEIQDIRSDLREFVDSKDIKQTFAIISDKEIKSIGDILGISQREIKRVFLELVK